MVTRIFRSRDGRANASVTVEGAAQHRVEVTIDGEEVEFTPRDDAAPASSAGRTSASTAVSVRVTSASRTDGQGDAGGTTPRAAASVRVCSSNDAARRDGLKEPPAGGPGSR